MHYLAPPSARESLLRVSQHLRLSAVTPPHPLGGCAGRYARACHATFEQVYQMLIDLEPDLEVRWRGDAPSSARQRTVRVVSLASSSRKPASTSKLYSFVTELKEVRRHGLGHCEGAPQTAQHMIDRLDASAAMRVKEVPDERRWNAYACAAQALHRRCTGAAQALHRRPMYAHTLTTYACAYARFLVGDPIRFPGDPRGRQARFQASRLCQAPPQLPEAAAAGPRRCC